MTEDDEIPAVDGSPSVVEDNSLGRLFALADGVFAIAATLLALDLKVPDLDLGTDAALRDALSENRAAYLSFLLTFYVIAMYWVRHRRLMRSVVTNHPVLVRDTLFLLLIISAMPFFTALLGSYGSKPTALALYGAANALATLTLIVLHHDIKRLGLADDDDGDEPDHAYRPWNIWLNFAIFALCIPGSYLLGRHGPYLLMLLIVPNLLSLVWRRQSTNARGARA